MTALLLALLLQAPGVFELMAAAPGPAPRVSYGALVWKIALMRSGQPTEDVWGGRAYLNGRIVGRLRGVVRADASALPGDEFVASDPRTYKALEGYAGLYLDAISHRNGISAGPVLIGGLTRGFDLEGQRIESNPKTYGGGVRLGFRGAWLYVLAAVHEAAGSGVRVAVATQIPIWSGSVVVLDWVGGEGGFVRVGLGYAVGRD